MNIEKILEEHQAWLLEDGGKRANLSGADLREADLRCVNLRRANLSEANLRGAVLRGANLYGINLRGADLSGADLSGADLRWANLSGASLYKADLGEAILNWTSLAGANLCGANLCGADLREADLHLADLSETNLRGVNLRKINFTGATLPAFQIVPPNGAFVAWKKAADGVVLKLEIPEDARRTSCLVSRKCRAEKARVLEAYTRNGEPLPVGTTVKGWYSKSFEYCVGEIAVADSYDDDIRIACAPGIHFFLTREEAEKW